MQFDRIIGTIDPKIIATAEDKLTQVFLELGSGIQNDFMPTSLGGDPLIFALIVPAQHVATLNIPTAATDGKKFYWNPQWLATKNLLGIRLSCYHESAHALYMHPQRRGRRILKLWNIAVDFIVNGMIMEDLFIRKEKSEVKMRKAFIEGLGNFCTLEQCIAMFKDPNAKVPGMEHWIPEPEDPNEVQLPAPDDDRELTAEEKTCLENKKLNFKFFYADPHLEEDMKRPERIYDILYHYLPQCPECGRVGIYPNPQKVARDITPKETPKEAPKTRAPNKKEDGHDHGHNHASDSQNQGPAQQSGGSSSGNSKGTSSEQKNQKGASGANGQCGTCTGGFDILDFGDTVDQHMDTVEDPEEMAKRVSDAMQAAKEMAGTIPGALAEELALLSTPKIRWQDFIRTKCARARAGNSRNDWTRFRTRPMFAGLIIPKRTNVFAKFVCLLDTSASMTAEDMAFGVSQLSILDERSEGIIVPADAQIYWEDATKVRNANAAELCKIKIVGRGGTKFAEFFDEYEKKLGKADFLIIITDGVLDPKDMSKMQNPGKDVIWLITSSTKFVAPFGRVFDLVDG